MDQLYSKKGGERVFDFLVAPKVVWHNRVPPKHSYFGVPGPTHVVSPWKIVWVLIFNKGLIRHIKALTQIWLSKVNGPALLKERWRKGFCFFFNPKSCLAQWSTTQAFILLSNWATHEVSPWKIVWMLIFNKGLINKASIFFWKALHFKALTQIWLSKVNGPALLKERWRNGFWFFSTPKVVWHNRVPPKHSYYWVTEPLMRYHLEKLSGCWFLIRV